LPLGEGRRTQAKLRAQGIKVHRVPDRNIEAALRKVDAVLVGADAVLPGQGIINKVGTRQLAQSACRLGIPVFVMCGKEKRMRSLSRRLDFPLALKALDPEGYFESCPIKFLTRIVYP
jgi:translation initiation factor 2B subunit (eIF-2B alpha/beta/delta family)